MRGVIMAKFIGELAGVSVRTNKKGVTETNVTFRIDNNRYGKVVDLRDFQGLPCLVEIVQKKDDEDEEDTPNSEE
jgi:hypothetical protein